MLARLNEEHGSANNVPTGRRRRFVSFVVGDERGQDFKDSIFVGACGRPGPRAERARAFGTLPEGQLPDIANNKLIRHGKP